MYKLITNTYNQLERKDENIFNITNEKIGVNNEFL